MNLGSGKGQDFLLVLLCSYTMKRTAMARNFSATPTSSRNNHTQNRELEFPLLLATVGTQARIWQDWSSFARLHPQPKKKIKMGEPKLPHCCMVKNIMMVGSFIPMPTFLRNKHIEKKGGVEAMVENEYPLLAYTHNQKKLEGGGGGWISPPFFFMCVCF